MSLCCVVFPFRPHDCAFVHCGWRWWWRMPLALSFFFAWSHPSSWIASSVLPSDPCCCCFSFSLFFSPHILVCLPLSLLNLRYLVVDHASLFFLSLVSPRDVRVLLRRCSPTFECVCARVGASAVMWSIQRPSCCSAVGAARPTVDRFSFLFFFILLFLFCFFVYHVCCFGWMCFSSYVCVLLSLPF